MNGRVTTHVLDLSCGGPATGVRIELYRITEEEGSVKLSESVTNADGRLNEPLLSGNGMLNGSYELLFHVGDYYRSSSHEECDGPMFLEQVPIRFSIVNSQDHYHVPLLVAPGGYSTYRGS